MSGVQSRAGSLSVPQPDEESSSKTSLVINKSTVDASALLMRFAGKPAKKEKSQQEVKDVKTPKKKDTNEQNKAAKTKNQQAKNQHPKATRGSIPKEPRGSIPKEPRGSVPKESTVKQEIESQKENGEEMPDWYEELDDENLSSFRELFNMLDQSNTGIITAENLYEELRRVDSEITFEEVEDVLRNVDKDGSGTIDFDEFLYHMTQMGDDLLEGLGGADKEKKERFTRRKRLFYSAITQFSLKQTLADLEKTFRIRQAPHVISHYTAGARLIGLTTRQLEQQMKKMQKTAAKNDSPYAKPLQFVHMGTKKIVKRNIKSGRSALVSRASVKDMGSKPDSAKDSVQDDEEKADAVENISKQIQNQLRLLAQRGSVVAQLPDAHKIIEWRQKIGTVSAKLRSDAGSTEKQNLLPVIEEPPKPAEPPKGSARSRLSFVHSFVTIKSPDSDRKGKAKESPQVSPICKRPRLNRGWTVPRIVYLGVPLPRIKMKYKSKKPTFNDLPSIRAKAKDATDMYYRNLRQTEIKNAWAHWDKLYADVIRPKKLLDNFRKVYDAYSPHREEEAFVVCPWKPGPFIYLRHNQKPVTRSLPTSPDFALARHSPRPFKDRNDLVIRPLTPLA